MSREGGDYRASARRSGQSPGLRSPGACRGGGQRAVWNLEANRVLWRGSRRELTPQKPWGAGPRGLECALTVDIPSAACLAVRDQGSWVGRHTAGPQVTDSVGNGAQTPRLFST